MTHTLSTHWTENIRLFEWCMLISWCECDRHEARGYNHIPYKHNCRMRCWCLHMRLCQIIWHRRDNNKRKCYSTSRSSRWLSDCARDTQTHERYCAHVDSDPVKAIWRQYTNTSYTCASRISRITVFVVTVCVCNVHQSLRTSTMFLMYHPIHRGSRSRKWKYVLAHIGATR